MTSSSSSSSDSPPRRARHTPRLSGAVLASAARVVRSRVGAMTLPRLLRAELKVDELARLPDAMRGELPLDVRPLAARAPREAEDARLGAPTHAWSGTSEAYASAYRAGTLTPSDVVERVFERARSLASHAPFMGPLWRTAEDDARREAAASTARWRAGHPRGPLDGVPCAIKEEVAVRGMPWGLGSDLGDPSPQPRDGTSVARLRDAGAIIVGVTAMTEYGMTPSGINPKRPMPRNPHATDTVAGGSSTGSAVAVATGLVPFAMGADGGGSIRIPSALCGVFGIKPTWGRVSRDLASGGSVAHLGPLASSALDLARVLEASSGHDPLDRETHWAPPRAPGELTRAVGRGVRGLVIAIDDAEWADASPEIARAGQDALRALEKEGAKLTRARIALAPHAAAIGYVSIAVEARAILGREWRERAADFTPDLQIAFAALDVLTATDLLDAQRLRSGLRREVAGIFREADLLALPSTMTTAMPVTDAEMRTGVLDAALIEAFCRFAFLGNLTGLPASSAPVGRDAAGLPIGLQLVGDAWDEATVLAATAHLERVGAARVERPRVSVDVLGARP